MLFCMMCLCLTENDIVLQLEGDRKIIIHFLTCKLGKSCTYQPYLNDPRQDSEDVANMMQIHSYDNHVQYFVNVTSNDMLI